MAYNAKNIFFALIRVGASNGCLTVDEKAAFNPEMLPEIYKAAQKHDLSHLLGFALKKEGLMPSDWEERFEQRHFESVCRYEQMEYELENIRSLFDENKLQFIPLKGAVIRGFYPEGWMRTSCDVDILVHKEDINRAVKLLSANGWVAKDKIKAHDVSLFSASGVHLELHFNLHENIKCLDRVLDRVWEYSSPCANVNCEYRQSNEFLIFHLLSHMSYHFISGGCGVRSLIDLWLVENQLDYDKEKLQELCVEAEIDVFAESINSLINVWFNSGEYTPTDKKIEKVIITGGLYGNARNKVSFDQAASGGKGKNLIKRIFMPYDSLKFIFPSLDGKKALIPFYWVARWFRIIFKGRLKHAIGEINENTSNTRDSVKETEAFLAEIGLSSIKK